MTCDNIRDLYNKENWESSRAPPFPPDVLPFRGKTPVCRCRTVDPRFSDLKPLSFTSTIDDLVLAPLFERSLFIGTKFNTGNL